MTDRTVTIVICARNEASRIERAIASAKACNADELLVVDGGSTDETVAIAERLGVKVIRSGGFGLAFDRQLGADATSSTHVAFIDADHRPAPDAITSLLSDMESFGFDVVQAGVGIEDNGFWNRAEHDAFVVFHHRPGPRHQMLGVAPAIFRKDVLQAVRFDEHNRLQSDDADLFKRIVDARKYHFGVGRTVIDQEHHSSLSDYVAKFRWYGQRDAEFMIKHPERAHSMAFHLLVRYPIWRPLKALFMGRPRAIAYFWACGGVRLAACGKRLIARAFGRAATDRVAQSGETSA